MTASPFAEARCVGVQQENWNVRTFRFRVTDSNRAFTFHAGQYVTLGCEIAGETVFRCYTVSCAPQAREAGEFEITVKHSPGGVVSTWLHEQVQVDTKVEVSHATGDFILPDSASEPLLFVAGGVGITPLMSMVRYVRAEHIPANIQFLQFARTPEDILFRSELVEISATSPGVVTHYFTSRSDDSICKPGRLCADLLDAAVPDWKLRRVLCCGPDSFMSDMQSTFVANGGDPTRFHQESFNIPDATPAHVVESTGDTSVRLSESDFETPCVAGQTVLEAVHSSPQGVKIPNACRSGVCGTCKVRKLDGQVDMQHNGGITEEEEEEGFILACCSIPLTNVTIEY